VEDVDWKGVSTNVMRHGFHFVTQIAVQLGCKTEKAKHTYKDGDGCPVLKRGCTNQKEERYYGPQTAYIHLRKVFNKVPDAYANKIVGCKSDVEQGRKLVLPLNG